MAKEKVSLKSLRSDNQHHQLGKPEDKPWISIEGISNDDQIEDCKQANA